MRGATVNAVDDVSLAIYPGETLGLVGESGSGKSLTCLSILRLLPDRIARVSGGDILFENQNLLDLSKRDMRQVRGKKLAVILQDPMTSLNPVLTISDQVGEAISLCHGLRGTQKRDAVIAALRDMRIPAPETRIAAYPHQMSGGMRQRVGAAIAMAGPPRLLIADEPTTALDATVQAQFLALLRDVQRDMGLAILFVTHDFGIVATMCDRVAVMYAGRIVETAPARALFATPAHPYTAALLRAVPELNDDSDRLATIDGQPPSLHALPPGCSFAPRCTQARAVCHERKPPSYRVDADHHAACWNLGTDAV